MTDFKNTLKSTALILITGLLFACQNDSSADTSHVEKGAAVVEQSSTPVTEKQATITTVKEVVEETVNVAPPAEIEIETAAVVETAISKPKAPADFSNLDSNSYKPVSAPFDVSTGNDIEVAELFWFGCGHCYALEPHVKNWLKNKPANAKFKKVPAIFSKRWEFHGKAFYTMEALSVPELAYDQFFQQIHVQKKSMNSLDSLVSFLAPFGKDKATVENTFNSFAVDSKLRNAIKITKASGARGVPAMIVDGKYLTSQGDAGGTSEMFNVVDKLVAKAASER